MLGDAQARVRPRRARCRSCQVTVVLLPAWCAPRRAHAIEVIGTRHGYQAASMTTAAPGPARNARSYVVTVNISSWTS